MPDMLASLKEIHMGFPTRLLEAYYDDHSEDLNVTREAFFCASATGNPEVYAKFEEATAACNAQWNSILDEMIFLLREANEKTCSKQNPFVQEYERACEEFSQKYGDFGEALLSAEEKAASTKEGTRIHTPSELPEYRDVTDRYMEKSRRLGAYRRDCQDRALALFAKWFNSLND